MLVDVIAFRPANNPFVRRDPTLQKVLSLCSFLTIQPIRRIDRRIFPFSKPGLEDPRWRSISFISRPEFAMTSLPGLNELPAFGAIRTSGRRSKKAEEGT